MHMKLCYPSLRVATGCREDVPITGCPGYGKFHCKGSKELALKWRDKGWTGAKAPPLAAHPCQDLHGNAYCAAAETAEEEVPLSPLSYLARIISLARLKSAGPDS